MSQCPFCGTPLRPGAKFCHKCQTVINSAAATPDPAHGVCANGHAQVRPEAKFCYLCQAPVKQDPNPANGICTNGHAQVRPGAKFCYLCRAPVQSTLTAPNPAFGVCIHGHPQVRPGANFCYICRAPVHPSHTRQPQLATGPTFYNRYQVIGELGRGGMGSIVYKVQDLKQGNRVLALKEMDETLLDPPEEVPEIVKAFQREARLLGDLDHPNIAKAYDYFQEGQKHYMAMEVIDGRTLSEILETSPGGFPESRVMPWVEQLCDALGYLHEQTPPIIYRDMKPQNVMVENNGGQIKMIDFGIAREFKGNKRRGDTIKFGTAGYAAPEASTSKETRPCSDVYSLGAMMYQLLTGIDPTDEPFGFFEKSKLLHRSVGVSSSVADALEKALEMEMDDRFKGMPDFKTALTDKPASKARKSKGAKKPSSYTPPAAFGPPLPGLPVPGAGSALMLVQVSPNYLYAGDVEKGRSWAASRDFDVSLSGSGPVPVQAKAPWIQVSTKQARDGDRISVSVQPERLSLGHPHWDAPYFLAPIFENLPEIWRQGWWVVGLIFVLGFMMPLVWLGAIGIVVTALSVQWMLWSISWLLRTLVPRENRQKGEILVGSGAAAKIVNFDVRVVPSTWRKIIGWGGMVLAAAAQAAAIGGGLWWLITWLGFL